MSIATSDKELTFIYTNESSIAKQALGYIKSSKLKTNLINISETKLTGTQLAKISELLAVSLDELVSKSHPDVVDFAKDATMSDDHWIKFIRNNPSAIQQPIVIQGKRALQITRPSQVMEFIGVDSAGLEKKKLGERPIISNTTRGEKQV